VSAFTPRQQARLQDMFDSADEFIAEYRVSEIAEWTQHEVDLIVGSTVESSRGPDRR